MAELNEYYSACVSYYDTGEDFHQGFMLGLLGSLITYYDVVNGILFSIASGI